jgi:hypothetical protein
MDNKQLVDHSIQLSGQLPQSLSSKVLVPYLLTLSIQFVLALAIFLPANVTFHPDFRNTYSAGYMVRTGHGYEIYDENAQKTFQNALVSKENLPLPFIRPAYQALFYVPFSLLPFRQAYFVFLVLNLAALLLSMLLLHPYLTNLYRLGFYLPSLLLLFFPITVALWQGQDSILLLALLAGTFVCIQRNREYAAGTLVAIGLFKFQFAIPIFLLFLAWRRWRFSAAFACATVILAGISMWIIGLTQAIDYSRALIGVGSTLGFQAGSPLKMSLMANLHGALYEILNGSTLVLPMTAAVSAVVMLLLAWSRPRGVDALLVAIPASALVSYYMFAHDLCVLILPIAILLDRLVGAEANHYRYRRLQQWIAVLLLVAPTVLILNITQFWLVSFPLLAFTIAIAVGRPTAAQGRETAAC